MLGRWDTAVGINIKVGTIKSNDDPHTKGEAKRQNKYIGESVLVAVSTNRNYPKMTQFVYPVWCLYRTGYERRGGRRTHAERDGETEAERENKKKYTGYNTPTSRPNTCMKQMLRRVTG